MGISKANKMAPAKQVKKTTKSAPKKAAKAAAPAPVAAPVVEEKTAPAEVETPFQGLMDDMSTFQTHLQAQINSLSSLKAEFKLLEKKLQKESRQYRCYLEKRRKKSGSRAPSGFVKPTRISDELAAFLGKAKGTEMARTEVTKEINTYIKTHDLKDKKNGRIIHPDSKLTKLLNISAKDELTYFNLQKYMSHHFDKAASKPSSA